MIGRAALASAAATAVMCGVLVGGGRDPSATVGASALVRQRSDAAASAIDGLDRALARALDAAREAAGRVLEGDGAPGERFGHAAALVEDAIDDADVAERAVEGLDAARRAADPDAEAVPVPPPATELRAIADDLRAAAGAANAAAELRARSASLVARLEESLESVASGDVSRARHAAAQARTDHASISAAGAGAVTLPIWLEATGAMISAVTRLIDATEAGDDGAMAAARSELASLSEEAATADRALDIAIADAASAATGAALNRLASAVAAVSTTRAAIEAVAEAAL